MSETLWHNGPIDEYRVRDCTDEEEWPFRDFDEADSFLHKRRADHLDNEIILIAVIDG